MFLTDIINQQHKLWQPGSTVIISAPTGFGKTFFILNVLLPYALQKEVEILYLCNRTALDQDLISKLCEMQGVPYELMKNTRFAQFRGITVTTYQTIQQQIGPDYDMSKIPFYHYVVADEIHYLACDSEFSAQVERFYEWFMQCDYPVKIAISATIECALPYLLAEDKDWTECYADDILTIYTRKPRFLINAAVGRQEYLYHYKIQPLSRKYKVYVYDDLEDLVHEINADKSEDRWLIFTSDSSLAKSKLIKKLDCSAALLTASNKQSATMENLIQNNRFSERVLVTTKVLDNGVSIHDTSVRKVVLDTTSKVDFLQMLGRRRYQLGEDVTLNLYIPRLSVNYFKYRLEQNILPALDLFTYDSTTLLSICLSSEGGRDLISKYFDCKRGHLVPNTIAKEELERKKLFYTKMIDKMSKNKNAFVEEQLSWLECASISKIIYLKEKNIADALAKTVAILEEKAASNKFLDKHKQVEFRKALRPHLKVLSSNKSITVRLPGLHLINKVLKELKLPYTVEVLSGKKKGQETQWKIKKI